MARYEHLPIYRKAFDLLVWLENAVRNFPRYYKYSLGQDLRNSARGIVRSIVRANQKTNRRAELERLREDIEELLVLIRVAKETRAFASLASYQHCANEALQIARQNEGWLKSQSRNEPESASPRPHAGGP